jgi:alkaline phosphatase
MASNRRKLTVGLLIFCLIIIIYISFNLQNPPIKYNSSYLNADDINYPLLDSKEVKNVILLIGDGMGINQIASARIKLCGANGRLYIERMPVTGFINTHSIDNLIPDSASTGTAMATGFKTRNKMISVTPEGEKLISILEACQKKGMSTGLIATSRITHATPATFACHVKSRYNQEEIAVQLINSQIDIMLGGGRDFFLPQTILGSKRKDNRNLVEEAQGKGYTYITTANQLKLTDSQKLLGLFQMGYLSQKDHVPSLGEMTEKSIELLNRNQKGFFLMVEGSQIDWAGHDNDTPELIKQMQFFDEAVKRALDFALKDQKTLVIVTADHETGGMSIYRGALNGVNMTIRWVTTNHTGSPVPLFSFGPSALRFTGIHDNTEIPKILAELLEIDNFPLLLKSKN